MKADSTFLIGGMTPDATARSMLLAVKHELARHIEIEETRLRQSNNTAQMMMLRGGASALRGFMGWLNSIDIVD